MKLGWAEHGSRTESDDGRTGEGYGNDSYNCIRATCLVFPGMESHEIQL